MSEASWYRRWFGEEYLQVYPHRDQGEAARGVDLVLRSLDPPPGSIVLDLACGAGRHLAELSGRDYVTFGLDLSLPLLRHAVEQGAVARGDMRELPFRSGVFDVLTNFFTSFGYFDDPEDDRRVLREVRRVLRTGGMFAFDFLHADRVRSALVPRDERTAAGGRRIVQTRVLLDGGRTVEKRIEIHDPANRLPHVFHERVRLYEPEELRRLLGGTGLEVTDTFGDYDGNPLAPGSSRVIHLGRAS
jgi:SAM-dependent methyltransferase